MSPFHSATEPAVTGAQRQAAADSTMVESQEQTLTEKPVRPPMTRARHRCRRLFDAQAIFSCGTEMKSFSSRGEKDEHKIAVK